MSRPRSGPQHRPAAPGVPYITRWSGETNSPMPMTYRRRGTGIAYTDERSFDRDEHGVLWARTPSQPGRGRPQYGSVHLLRQRLAMSGLRCQICGGPADRSADGVLWLLDADPDDPTLWNGQERTAHPPVCMPCAVRSTSACPHLRRSFTVLRVRAFSPYGVHGALYRPTTGPPRAVNAVSLPFGDPRMPWMRAGQLITRLTEFTVVDLESGTTGVGGSQ
ncbi:hypothetical protein OG900_20495 [Streptomyces sp. NBC_00433]